MRTGLFLSSLAIALIPLSTFGSQQLPAADPVTKVGPDQAIKIALAHLNIEKVAKDPNVILAVGKKFSMNAKGFETLKDGRRGIVKHLDLAGLPEVFDVHGVSVQQGFHDHNVYVSEIGGRVVAVLFRGCG